MLAALAATAAAAEPREVTIGVFVTSVSAISSAQGSFSLSFYAWVRDPAGRFDLARDLYVIARNVTFSEVETEPAPDGGTYTFARIDVTVDHEFDFRDFPFDVQRLRLRLEAAEPTDELVFVPDAGDTRISEYLHLVGWRIDNLSLRTETHAYDTNFGYWEGRGASYSQAILEIDAERVRSPVLIDDFLGFTFAVLITGLTFVVSCTELGLRIGMTTGSLFAAVTNLVRLDDAAGFKPDFGLVDRLAFLVFGAIVTSLLISLTTNRMSKRGEPEAAKARANRIDTMLGLANMTLFLALILWTLRGVAF